MSSSSPPLCGFAGNDIDSVRPQTEGEEELQLQLALAMSREEHEQEERKRRDDEAKEDMKLKMVLEESQREDDLVSWVFRASFEPFGTSIYRTVCSH